MHRSKGDLIVGAANRGWSFGALQDPPNARAAGLGAESPAVDPFRTGQGAGFLEHLQVTLLAFVCVAGAVGAEQQTDAPVSQLQEQAGD